MAEDHRYVAQRIDILKDASASQGRKHVAIEELIEVSSSGLSSDSIEEIFENLSDVKNTLFRSKLVECCLPRDSITHRSIDLAVFILSRPTTLISLKKCLLEWLLAGVQHFFTAPLRDYLRTYYGVIFAHIEYKNTLSSACLLLVALTEQPDVMRYRIDAALAMATADKAIDSSPLWSLISKFRLLRPDMVQCHLRAGRPFPGPRTRMTANVERWRERRDQQPQVAPPAPTVSLWGDGKPTKTRRARAPGVNVLPESVRAPGGGRPDPQQGCRELTSLATLDEAAAHAPFGFREANHVTTLLLTRERRTLFFTCENYEVNVTKANMDLAVLMRTMFVYRPGDYTSQQRRELARQLLLAQAGGLPLTAARSLMRLLLERGRPPQADRWLPALDLLPFYGWRPFSVLHDMLLRPLSRLAQPTDRHVRLHVVHVLTEYVLRLAQDDLPRVRARAFPYTGRTVTEEIDSSPDPVVDVGRTAEYVANICQNLVISSPNHCNLLRETLDFYNKVSPVLLECGVPVVPYIRKDVIHKVLLGSDVLALNKLLLMFSRYQELSRRLLAIRGSRRVSLMAQQSSRSLSRARDLLRDVRWLLYGRRARVRPFDQAAPAVRDALVALTEEAYLPNHPATVSYQLLAEQEADMDEDHVQRMLRIFDDSQLTGFSSFSEQYLKK